MKYHLIICLFFLLLGACSSSKSTYSGEETVIQNVNLIPMVGEEELKTDQTVVIRHGKIYQIGEHTPSPNATIIDGSGKYLMPGLTEMHAHIPVAREGNDSLVKETLFLYLSQGVTTIRGMLGDPYHLELRKQVINGTILGPRIYTSSPSMNGNSCPTPEIARERVERFKKDGYDFLKIHPGIKISVWDTLEAVAKAVDMPYAGHVPAEVGIQRAIEAGYQTIDHLDGYIQGLVPEGLVEYDINQVGFFGYALTEFADEEGIEELVAKTKARNVAVVPTQTLFTRWFSPKSPAEMMNEPEMQYMSPQTRFAWRQNKERMIAEDGGYSTEKWEKYVDIRKKILKAMDEQGVPILMGSDAPQVMNVPGFSIHHELQSIKKAGISNYNVLKASTIAPATFFGAKGKFGTIEEEADADLLLLNGNPLEDLSQTQNIEYVIVRGKTLDKKSIQDKLSSISEHYQTEE